VATAAGGLLVPDRPVEVIGRTGVEAILWPLSPVLLAAVVPASTAWRGRPLERTARRGLLPLAGRHLLALGVAAGAVALTVPDDQLTVTARNLAGLVGLALLGARVLAIEVAWSPLVLLGAVTWLFGTEAGGRARPWALLLAEPRHTPAAAVAAGVLAAGVLAHLTSPPRGGGRPVAGWVRRDRAPTGAGPPGAPD
jgi:hypothetical protein